MATTLFSSDTVVPLTVVAISPLLAELTNYPLPGLPVGIQSNSILGFDFALSAWLMLIAMFLYFGKADICLFVSIWGLISWFSGVTNLFSSLLLYVEYMSVFAMLGWSKSDISVVHSMTLTLAPLWMSGSWVIHGLIAGLLLVSGMESLSRIVRVWSLVIEPILLVVGGAILLLLRTQAIKSNFFSLLGVSVSASRLWTQSSLSLRRVVSGATLFVCSAIQLPNPAAAALLFMFLCLALTTHYIARPAPFSSQSIRLVLAMMICRSFLVPSPAISRLGTIDNRKTFLSFSVAILACSFRLASDKFATRLADFSRSQTLVLLFACTVYGILRLHRSIEPSSGVALSVSLLAFLGCAALFTFISSTISRPITIVVASFVALFWAAMIYYNTNPVSLSWYDMEEDYLGRFCASMALSRKGHWADGMVQSPLFALDQVKAFKSEESVACKTSLPPPSVEWSKAKVLVLGDSVGRLLFYSLANVLVNEHYGFPTGAFHGNIDASKNFLFVWSPLAGDLQVASDNRTYDVLVLSCGLWDKLWKRDPKVYEQQLTDFFRTVAIRGGDTNRYPVIVLVETTPTIDRNLVGVEKQQYLTESSAQIWRTSAESALNTYPGPWFLIPTVNMLKGRASRDGVHYQEDVYQAIANVMLRGVIISSTQIHDPGSTF